MKAPCHQCARWAERCTASHRLWAKCTNGMGFSEFKARHGVKLYTLNENGTWDGFVQHFGKCNFSVIGTYGDNRDPRISINRSEECLNCHHAAIDWKTGKVLRFFGTPNGAVDCIE